MQELRPRQPVVPSGMVSAHRISTDGLPSRQRVPLIRDTADRLFNVDADLSQVDARRASADIRVARHDDVGLVRVRTSASTVTRSPARARAAASGHLLLYVVEQDCSAVENARGEQFTTAPGSVFIGSQDVAYAARAAAGANWDFQTLSIPDHLLPASRTCIRQHGFQQVVAGTAPFRLFSSHLRGLLTEFMALDAQATRASMQALDALLAAALGHPVEPTPQVVDAIAESRRRAAMDYIHAGLGLPGLSPEQVGRHLHLSARQLHRCFEGSGQTVSGEIRRLRLRQAGAMLATWPSRSITEVALACGFDSLATFYRAFRAGFGMTASEWRDSRSATRDGD